MLYFIERFDACDIQFPNSTSACDVNGKIYDIVDSPKDSQLESVATHILNTGTMYFDKSEPREMQEVKEVATRILGVPVNELLLG